MKKWITKEQQEYINSLMKKKKQMTVSKQRERITSYDWDNRISREGLTYLQIEQLDKQFNDYKK